MDATNTAHKLLDAAQSLVQQRGFNAFSYKDLAGALGITTASVHYHFETKAALGTALMARYLKGLENALDEIDRRFRTNKTRLNAFVDVFRDTEKHGVICLCGSMASDLETLPEEAQLLVQAHIDRTEGWVTEKIADGIRSGEFSPTMKPAVLAAAFFAGLQGALLLSRARNGASILNGVERAFMTSLGLSPG